MLTELQRTWLWSRGGRTELDVYVNMGEVGVDMYNPSGVAFIPIPEDKYITLYRDAQGYVQDKIRGYDD